MAALRIWPYTPSVYAPYPAEGMSPGSWHEVQLAYRDRYLSREESDSLRPLAPEDLTAQLVAPPDNDVRDRVVPIADALRHHVAIRNSSDLAAAPDACSCHRWDPTGERSWEEHVAVDALARQGAGR